MALTNYQAETNQIHCYDHAFCIFFSAYTSRFIVEKAYGRATALKRGCVLAKRLFHSKRSGEVEHNVQWSSLCMALLFSVKDQGPQMCALHGIPWKQGAQTNFNISFKCKKQDD